MTAARETVFCDWNAGAPPDPRVLDCFVRVEHECPGNPASVHGAGRRARAELEGARARIAAALGVSPDDVVFTSGGTEADNLAVLGLGDPDLAVLLASTEHPATIEAARQRGIVEWDIDTTGRAIVCDPGQPVGLAALVHAQSELGTLQPVAVASELARSIKVPLFIDAAQSLGRVALQPIVDVADAFALSPHKCGGLRGHGILVVRDAGARLRPLLRGGGQEQGLRPGTQSPALAAANALAVELAITERAQRETCMLRARDSFLCGLRRCHVDHRVLTPLDASLANTVMIAFPTIDGRNLLPMLDLVGIQASHGSACSSGSPSPPPILRRIGLDEATARACVRFSFGWREADCELEEVGRRVGDVLAAARKKN